MRKSLIKVVMCAIFSVTLLQSILTCTAQTKISKAVNSIQFSGYKPTSTSAIIYNKKYIGSMKLNFMQKYDVYDWFNNAAVKNDLLYTYAANFTITTDEIDDDLKGTQLTIKAFLVDENDNVVGKTANVGWSGYENKFALFKSNESTTCEVLIQPMEVVKDTKLKIILESANGESSQAIYYKNLPLDKLQLQHRLYTAGEPVQISSATGAEYIFSIDSVYRNPNCYEEGYASSDKGGLPNVFDVDYRLKYSKPANSETSIKFNKEQMNTKLSFSLQSDTKPDLFYDNADYLYERQYNYRENGETSEIIGLIYEHYVTDDSLLGINEVGSYTSNRYLKGSNVIEFARVILEFPEEVTRDFSKDFNGRYLIYQIPVKQKEVVSW